MVNAGVERAWCSTCQADVEVVSISIGTEGIERPRCANCGSYMDEEKEAGQEFPPAEAQETPAFSADRVAVPIFKTVMIVGYRDDVRSLILEQMTLKNLARDILPCENGEEMIIQTINALQRDEDGEVSLVMLGVSMPFLNGINAAIGLRAVERTYPGHRLVPLLFLTRKPCDETFKKVIKFLSPAKYASLGPSDNPAELGPRLGRIISLIAQEKW
jgi:CheY-like chemotaxis protein